MARRLSPLRGVVLLLATVVVSAGVLFAGALFVGVRSGDPPPSVVEVEARPLAGASEQPTAAGGASRHSNQGPTQLEGESRPPPRGASVPHRGIDRPVPDRAPWAPAPDRMPAEGGAAALGSGTRPEQAPPPPSPPPPPPVVASELSVEDVGPHSAVVRFTTDQDVAGVVGFGWDAPVSFASDDVGQSHRVELRGLVPDTEYVASVFSHTGEEKPELRFLTEPRPLSPDAAIVDGRLELDGQPFFPVAAYGACAWTLDNPLAAGVNVFQWDRSCGLDEDGLLESIDALADSAYWTLPWDDRDLTAEGLIGFTQTDEPDGLALSPSALPDVDEPGKVTFMTLTQHFSPGTGALPWQYPGYYEALARKADVLGVDFYPLQGLCSPEKLALNHDVQVDLLQLAGGKPTLQWIEAASMNCPARADTAITPETLRAEMLLAIAGGANGLGIFPARLDDPAARAVRSTLDAIEQAWPMLMTVRLPVEIAGDGASLVRASARASGGATMIVVANADPTLRAAVDLRVNGLEDGQRLVSVDSSVEATVDDVVHLELAPLEAHILVAPPAPPEGMEPPEPEMPTDETGPEPQPGLPESWRWRP